MGKTLVDRMGEQEARVAMRGVKRGQVRQPRVDILDIITAVQQLVAFSVATLRPAVYRNDLSLLCSGQSGHR